MLNLTDNITVPKLTDVFNGSNFTNAHDILRMFTYPWVEMLGGWFFAMVIGFLAAALYIKYENAMIPVVFSIVMCILFGAVLRVTTPALPSASIFIYIVAVLAAFAIGFMLYELFVKD